MITARLEGLEATVANLGDLSRAVGRSVLRRTLTAAGQPLANMAAARAPHRSGRLAFSIVVSTSLTRRQRRGAKVNEVEVYIGPAGGLGALNYASFEEFGTIHNVANAFMRSSWDALKAPTLELIVIGLHREVGAAAARAARRVARLAA